MSPTQAEGGTSAGDALRPHRLVLATRNRKKLKELQEILSELPLELLTLDAFPDAPEVEETGHTFDENARLKAETVGRALGEWVLADDSGLEVDALGGAPGVISARYSGANATDASNRLKLLQALVDVPQEQRGARFRCVIVLVAPDGRVWQASGACEGRILEAERGTGGFGYDPLFWVEAWGRTMAELSAEEKHGVSRRGEALRALKGELGELLGAVAG